MSNVCVCQYAVSEWADECVFLLNSCLLSLQVSGGFPSLVLVNASFC